MFRKATPVMIVERIEPVLPFWVDRLGFTRTVEVPEGGSVDLTGDDETFTEWTADIADPEVVEFVPGREDGSAQFNPGLTAESVGSTEVTLENGESGDTVTFTVDVVPSSGY